MSFATIAIDPPWPERGGGGKGAQAQYDVVAVQDLPRVIMTATRDDVGPVWVPAADAHLYLWATNAPHGGGLVDAGAWVSLRDLHHLAQADHRHRPIFPWAD
jgi:hypothetical protein